VTRELTNGAGLFYLWDTGSGQVHAVSEAVKMTRAAKLTAGPIPLYHQLEQELRRRIDGELEPGSPLPSEDRICEEYGVSRITVRRALEELTREGVIFRKRGVGSFVAEAAHGMNSQLTGSLHEFLSAASSLRTTLLSQSERFPPAAVRKLFDLTAGERATNLKTLGSLDDEGPVAFVDIWFPEQIGSRLDPAQLGEKVPVIRLVERALGIRIARAEQIVEADHAGEEAGDHLGIAPDTPILRVRRIYYDASNAPVEVALARYHPDRYRYAIDFR
jgi:GntR family transcriptional regulator